MHTGILTQFQGNNDFTKSSEVQPATILSLTKYEGPSTAACAIFCSMLGSVLLVFYLLATGADPGFLERGYLGMEILHFADFISFS